MAELKEIQLTKSQSEKLLEVIKSLKKTDYSVEVALNDFCGFQNCILASASGYLAYTNIPFSCVYDILNEWLNAYWINLRTDFKKVKD